ncbi:hypothetical protein B296_00020799, partial [Ensete ventricosum]
MVSTPSFSVSSFSSPLSSLVPPPREERCRSNDSLGNQSIPKSSSSGVMIGADAKAFQALEAMKLHHDFDSTVYLESLGSVQKRFSISSGAEVPSSPRHWGVSQLVAGVTRSDRAKLLASWNCTLGSGSSTVASVDPAHGVRVNLRCAGDPHRGGQGGARGFS